MQTELYVKHKKRNSNKKASFARYVEHAVNKHLLSSSNLNIAKGLLCMPCRLYVLRVVCDVFLMQHK